jgi:hypothetical protein
MGGVMPTGEMSELKAANAEVPKKKGVKCVKRKTQK